MFVALRRSLRRGTADFQRFFRFFVVIYKAATLENARRDAVLN